MQSGVYNEDGELIGYETTYEEDPIIINPSYLDNDQFENLFGDHSY